MLRIHFTVADLNRTRVATAPDPLWELTLSMHQLRRRGSPPLLAGWKADLAHRLRPDTTLRHEISPALALNPPTGYFPDFLTPAEAADGFEAGLQALLDTPRDRLRAEIALLGTDRHRLDPAALRIGDGDPAALRTLGRALRRYHDVAVAPMWDRIRASFDADRALRARTVLDGGAVALLNGLHPAARFTAGVLEIANYRADRDLHLDGRGLVLVPSYFKAASRPMALVDPNLPPVLVYPVERSARVASEAGRASLSALLGRTRAAVLELAADGPSTGTVAGRLGISAPAASEHLTVLRDAGLVVSTRQGNTVRHTLAPLGHTLLDGGP
ncbi:helix-turn-helix domain-containing protein [Polymorphospora sp. NPDC050346]|uniref:ArsR/SmtB family transcription factor n=1 Tax=Polymorphospora sp. NPDC050346 TaxID=3155780 RepID=UPI0033C628BA